MAKCAKCRIINIHSFFVSRTKMLSKKSWKNVLQIVFNGTPPPTLIAQIAMVPQPAMAKGRSWEGQGDDDDSKTIRRRQSNYWEIDRTSSHSQNFSSQSQSVSEVVRRKYSKCPATVRNCSKRFVALPFAHRLLSIRTVYMQNIMKVSRYYPNRGLKWRLGKYIPKCEIRTDKELSHYLSVSHYQLAILLLVCLIGNKRWCDGKEEGHIKSTSLFHKSSSCCCSGTFSLNFLSSPGPTRTFIIFHLVAAAEASDKTHWLCNQFRGAHWRGGNNGCDNEISISNHWLFTPKMKGIVGGKVAVG